MMPNGETIGTFVDATVDMTDPDEDFDFGINFPAWGAKKAAAPTSSIDCTLCRLLCRRRRLGV
jgi:hypothetical protein